MGNCMAVKNNVPMQDEKKPTVAAAEEEAVVAVGSRSEDADGRGNGGVVRLRIVVTQRELNQILNHKKQHSSSSSKSKSMSSFSIDHFLNALMESGRSIPQVRTGQDTVVHGGWRPALETILEDH